MNCCPNCFNDEEVIGYIKSNSTQIGNCDYCGFANTSIIPPSELLDELFQELILSYEIPNAGVIPDGNFKLLYEHLNDWKIFKLNDPQIIKKLVSDIGNSLYNEDARLFEQIVAPRIMLDPNFKNEAQLYMETWSKFKDEIKHTNRFFITNSLNFSKLADILKPFQREYKKGKLFYRARTSDTKGLTTNLMGRPPAKTASAGRANPQGISYLYLSNDVKTTLYEVRATLFDYVSIATFKLKTEITIATLRNTQKISPFILENISTYLLYKQFLKTLEEDLIKPLRRTDSDLDYLPTQYLCEFIKSLGYDGIEYSSSLNPLGFNIALFSDEKVECTSVQVYEVNTIDYAYSALVT